MRNVGLLMASLEYIENHLCDDIRTEDVAEACFCSKSALEKIFRCVCHISVHDYIIRRRMMGAARRLAAASGESILDIAMEYGYSTHESFARAFRQVWNCKPSEFRKRKYTELFPRLQIPLEIEDEYIMQRRRVDISELYDLFRERKNCFFICCDIKEQMRINEVSRKAGDMSILETMNRMREAAGEEDVVFRIGGDEFCILTDSDREEYAAELAGKIRSRNGEPFSFEGRQIPLELHTVIIKLGQGNVNYEELFVGLHNAIKAGKS